MRAEIPVFRVEDRQLQRIDDSTHCVDDTAGQQPAKSGSWKSAGDLCKCQDAYPAHGDIEDGGEPLGTVDPAGLDDDTGNRDPPDQCQKSPARTIRQIGVYVPAINMKIIIWSIFFKILFTFGEMSSVW